VEPDTAKYLMLLYSSAANLLSFEGYTTQSIYDEIREHRQRTLKEFSIAGLSGKIDGSLVFFRTLKSQNSLAFC
jgi:hypothetical protein